MEDLLVYSTTQYIALCLFIAAMVGTPGPNNVMLTSSGANFGIKKTFRHMLGINLGLCSMIFLMSIGFAKIFEQFPASKQVLFIIGCSYLLYLAYKIATTKYQSNTSNESTSKPLTTTQSLVFQYVNPKAWLMSSNSVILYSLANTENYETSIATIIISFFIIGHISNILWTSFGVLIRRFLKTPKRFRIFNISMASLLVACLPLMLNN